MAAQGPQPEQGASIQQLTAMAQRLGNLGRDDGPFNRVFITAGEVKRQQTALVTSLGGVFAIINRLGQSIQGLGELRQALEQGELNQYESIRRLDLLLRAAPTPEQINELIGQLREIAQQQGIPEEDLNERYPMAPLFTQEVLPENMPQEQLQGGRRPKTKKCGGYGWRGKRGVEVRSSIRTTRRFKAKKGKRSSSDKKKTKRSSSGKSK